MRFVLSDVDYALMEYYRYAGRILNVRAYRKILYVETPLCVTRIFSQGFS